MSSNESRYKTFAEFYPYYLSDHQKTGTRITHFIGTTFFQIGLIYSVIYGPWWMFFIGVVSAYTWAWIGHFFIEKKKPATFKYPLWSLLGDFKLYFEIIFFRESLKDSSND